MTQPAQSSGHEWPKIPSYLTEPIVFRDKNLGLAMVAGYEGKQWVFKVNSGNWMTVRPVGPDDPIFIGDALNEPAPVASVAQAAQPQEVPAEPKPVPCFACGTNNATRRMAMCDVCYRDISGVPAAQEVPAEQPAPMCEGCAYPELWEAATPTSKPGTPIPDWHHDQKERDEDGDKFSILCRTKGVPMTEKELEARAKSLSKFVEENATNGAGEEWKVNFAPYQAKEWLAASIRTQARAAEERVRIAESIIECIGLFLKMERPLSLPDVAKKIESLAQNTEHFQARERELREKLEGLLRDWDWGESNSLYGLDENGNKIPMRGGTECAKELRALLASHWPAQKLQE